MQVDRLGTSMGGLIGMLMAVVPGNPIRHMLVNVVGPYVPKAALERIDRYLSTAFFSGICGTLSVMHLTYTTPSETLTGP